MRKLYLLLTALCMFSPTLVHADSLCGMLGSGVRYCPGSVAVETLSPETCSITATTDAERAVQLENYARLITGIRESLDTANRAQHLCYLYSKLDCNSQSAEVVTPEMRAAFTDKCTAILFPPAGPTTPPDPTPAPTAPFDPKDACKMIKDAKGLCGNKLITECGSTIESMMPADITLVKKACMESGGTFPLDDCSKKFCSTSDGIKADAVPATPPSSGNCSLSLMGSFNLFNLVSYLFLALPLGLRFRKRKML